MGRTIILVHGAWHGSWTWGKLKPHLERRSFTVIAPDLPGHGADKRPEQVTLAVYADAVTDHLDALPLDPLRRPVWLLGHSMSGAVISEVAERRPERIAGLIYMSAFLLPDGTAMSRRMKEDSSSAAARHSIRMLDRAAVVMAEDGVRAVYDGCTEQDIGHALEHMQPQPLAPFVTPVHVTGDRFGRVPRIFIECTLDKAITLDMQRRMQAGLPCREVITLASGHMPHVQMPERLAEALDKICS